MTTGSLGAAHLTGLTTALSGRYRLERELGAGGMATVWLAEDLRHERRVAIKVLHPELSAVLGPERFLAEIKTTANLQHPHILPLFDSGSAEGLLYYVMPFVAGETLRTRLAREGPLPIVDAVRIATEVAGALDYAHRHGVIHRDVKPENILLHEGRALVADFGIALAVQQAGGQRMTQTGLSLGTPQYMAPEQAMGERSIDARADVYALGAVTYEMLAGEPPFTGPTAQAIVARMMTEPPRALAMQRPSVPPHVEAAVRTALEKLPADRCKSAAAFVSSLVDSDASATAARAAARRRPRVLEWIPWALAATLAVWIGADAVRGPRATAPAVARFTIMLPEAGAWVDQPGPTMALSPDGRHLVYNGRDSSGVLGFYVRSLDRLQPVPLRGGEIGSYPFFSPDGRTVGFLVSNRIVRVPLAGGVPETVCDAGGYVAQTWLERDVIVFADSTGLRQCTMAGEMSTLLASPAGERFDTPHALPGDRGIVFSVRRGAVSRLAALDLGSGAARSLDILGSDPRYVEGGHLVFTAPDGVVRAVRFDLRRLAATGEPAVVLDGARVGDGIAKMAVSRSGTIVTAPDAAARTSLELVDRTGRGERLYPEAGEFSAPRLSPDGRTLAVSVGNRSIWLVDLAQRGLTRLSFDSSGWRPAWSPDGRRVSYVRVLGTTVDLRVIDADGGRPADSLLAIPGYDIYHGLFTPDGREIVARTTGGLGGRDIWLAASGTSTPPRALLATTFNEESPALSPDGRWLAYVSDESGRREVYVRSFPAMGARYAVSTGGGTEPMWSPRGDELFYRNGPSILAAEVRTTPGFEVVQRSTLFSSRDYVLGQPYQEYDVTRDARHFVMVRNLGGQSYLTVTLGALDGAEPDAAAGALRR